MLTTPDDGLLYIVGDCILTDQIGEVVRQYKPQVCIVNAPRAQMLLGTIITMTPQDIMNIHSLSPFTKIIAVHMDAISHCTLTRQDLAHYMKRHNLLEKVMIPEDGEVIRFK